MTRYWIFFIFRHFWPKNGGHFEFWKVFQKKIQRTTRDPREVIVWKFEGSTSNGLVAMAFFRHFWPFFGGHFEFWKVFQKNFSKDHARPQRGHCVKIWRSYVKRSSRYGFFPSFLINFWRPFWNLKSFSKFFFKGSRPTPERSLCENLKVLRQTV